MGIRERSKSIILMVLTSIVTPLSFADVPTDTLPAASYTDIPNTYIAPARPDNGHAHFVFQAGGFNVFQGKSQFVAISDLVGDSFTLTKRHDNNYLLGLGFFIN